MKRKLKSFFILVVFLICYFLPLKYISLKGPLMESLALPLAGPALSLPNMLVIRGVLGTGKTAVYVGLVVIMATFSGILFGFMTG